MAGPAPKLRELFNKAVECQTPDEQAAYLGQACQGNAALRAQLEELLQAHREAGSFLQGPSAPAAGTIDFAAPAERPGTVIGPYKLLQQIGEGGMGTVFMAEQTRPVQRKVALKVIKAGMDSGQVIARFEAERQALALMDHVNIARVFDGGTTEAGRPYFVMELVHGVPITRYCDDNHLTPRERLELFVPVCQAIQHAHQKGIIHRDVKPSNVLVTLYDGKPVPKVIDFGVAKATEHKLTERTLFTQYGTMVGTLEYMSPEQAEMSALGVDTRSDIYSLGVLLYELLTGSTPLTHKRMKDAAYAEILRMIREEEPPRPSTRLSDSGEALASISAQRHTEPAKLTKLVRGELDWIVMKTLEKDRNRRYETASGFAADLQRYLNDEPVQACPPSALYRFRKFARRNKRALATITVMAVAVLVTMVALAVSNVLIQRETAQKEEALNDKTKALEAAQVSEQNAKIQESLAKASADKAEAERRTAKANETTAKAQGLLARRRFYAAQMNLAMQAWEKGDLARVLDLLESQRPGPGEEDLRAFEWHYLWRLCHSGRRLVLDGHSGYVHAVTFSPDGKTLATGSGDGTVKLWDMGTGRARRTLKAAAGVNAVAFSPDGEAVVAGCSDGLIRLWDLGTGDLRTTFRGHQDIVWAVAFAANGKTLVSGSQDRTVMLWDVATGTRQATLEGHGFPVLHAAISPDGKTAASASWPQLPVKVWDIATRRQRFEVPGRTVTFSADGTLATTDWFGVKLWDAATGKERARSPNSDEVGEAGVSAFSPDGKTLVFVSFTRTVWLWDILRGELRARLGRQGPIRAIAVSPDGRALAVAANDGPVEVWDRAPAEETHPLAHRGDDAVTFAFSPDRKTLASGGASGARFWDLATGRVLADVASSPAQYDPTKPYSTKPAWTALAGALAFSPDGAILAVPDDKNVKLIDAATHREVGTLVGHDQPVHVVAFSGDGKFLATLAPDGAKRWDLATRQVTTVIPQCPSSCLAFSPDGRTLVTGGQGRLVELWDAVTGRRKAELAPPGEHYEWTRAVTFSPDGKTLAVGGTDGHIALWDVDSGRLRAALRGETQIVATLAFSPDGKTLASGTERTVKLWEVATGQERITLKRGASILAFSPDGNTLGVGLRGQVLLLPALTDPPVAHMKLGQALHAEKKLDEAIACYKRAIELDPKSAVAYQHLGNALRDQNKPNEAIDAYREAIRLAPSNPYGRELRVWTLIELNQFAEAELAFREMVRLTPNTASGHFGLGRALQEQKKFVEAIAPLREAIRLNPSSHHAHGALGWVHFSAGEFAKAEPAFREQVRLEPKHASGHFGLGRALQEQKKFVEAIASLREAIRLDPSVHYVHGALGWTYVGNGEFANAGLAFREQIRLQPKTAPGHFGLGRALVEQEKFADAEKALREALRIEPADPWTRQLLSRALAGQGKRAEAEAILEENPSRSRASQRTQNEQ